MKKVIIAACVLLMSIMIAGCSTNSFKAYTFTVDNGDKIKITIDTSDDYNISPDLPFSISHDGRILSQGSFILGDAYEQYVSAVSADGNAKLLDSGIKDGHKYIFWCYNESEYNYVILISDSNTGIILGNLVSEESAKECFNRLEFNVEE